MAAGQAEPHRDGDEQRERDPERAEADGGGEVAVGALCAHSLSGRCRSLGERDLPVVRGHGGGDQQHHERLRHGVEVLQRRPAPLRVQRPTGGKGTTTGGGGPAGGRRARGCRRPAEDAQHVEYGLPDAGGVAARQPEPVRPPQRRAHDEEAPRFRETVRAVVAVERGLVPGVQERAAEDSGSGGQEDEPVDGQGVDVDAPRGCSRRRPLPLRSLDAPVERPHACPDERNGEVAEVRADAVDQVSDEQRERERDGYRCRPKHQIDVDLAAQRSGLRRVAFHGTLRRVPEQRPHREPDASGSDTEREGARAIIGDDVSGDQGEQGPGEQSEPARRGDERGEREAVQEDAARRPDAGVGAVVPRPERERDDAGRSPGEEHQRDDGDDEEVEIREQHRYGSAVETVAGGIGVPLGGHHPG